MFLTVRPCSTRFTQPVAGTAPLPPTTVSTGSEFFDSSSVTFYAVPAVTSDTTVLARSRLESARLANPEPRRTRT